MSRTDIKAYGSLICEKRQFFSSLTIKLERFLFTSLHASLRVRVKQRTYFPLVSAMDIAIWQAILT